MISIAGTNTESFSLGFTYNACVLASQTGLVAESCTIQYKGVTTTGVSVSTLCTFTADLLAPKAAPCSLPSSFTGLKNVSIVPVTASLPADTTILILDGVSGATVAKSKWWSGSWRVGYDIMILPAYVAHIKSLFPVFTSSLSEIKTDGLCGAYKVMYCDSYNSRCKTVGCVTASYTLKISVVFLIFILSIF